MLRNMGGALAGLVTLAAVSFAVEGLQIGLMPRWFNDSFPGMMIISLYTIASAFLGGYVAAWIGDGFRAAWIMAVMQTAFNIVAYSSMSDFAPTWVWISLIALVPAAILLGGRQGAAPNATPLSAEVSVE